MLVCRSTAFECSKLKHLSPGLIVKNKGSLTRFNYPNLHNLAHLSYECFSLLLNDPIISFLLTSISVYIRIYLPSKVIFTSALWSRLISLFSSRYILMPTSLKFYLLNAIRLDFQQFQNATYKRDEFSFLNTITVI